VCHADRASYWWSASDTRKPQGKDRPAASEAQSRITNLAQIQALTATYAARARLRANEAMIQSVSSRPDEKEPDPIYAGSSPSTGLTVGTASRNTLAI